MFRITPIKNGLCAIDGIYADGVNAGFKKDGFDVGFIRSEKIMNIAYLFTTNKFQAAPVKYVLNKNIEKTNFILANSKNANALTGEEGINDIKEILSFLNEKIDAINPIMSSTGVIGVKLNKEKIKSAIETLDFNAKNSKNFAKAIMTTDSFYKEIAFEVEGNFGKFKIAGVAKGAGMINPAMATMLCFIVTDANVPREKMKKILSEINDNTFNAISVDGDTSTNDSVFLMSTNEGDYEEGAFREALNQVMLKLATDIVKDGEGATKLVAFNVKGAKNKLEAKIAAKALANSLLVKTAIFGEDPNWGRIASTIGASGIECDENTLSIEIGDVLIYDKGKNCFDKVTEEKARKVMKKDSFKIEVDIGIGDGKFRAFGCDLSYDYVKINAEYRT
ncbi:bifunctional glutamate N-acetyltransferase/amino-acid acetyltransferase ArgJ [Lebetimonas sp. JH369]|uniref:bifunctional glutamate N-acetyltransferase/amino-acid acetyltransferase ArgJ n=1 Tax=Lebetimonas sp. JH369 TaxID=990069 RepID=UPI00046685EF|nr:bifunctional glutamate N-acetyltransferase/amino-acid acetyltransferase ArgJ [Lebetimonas sp. JH369]